MDKIENKLVSWLFDTNAIKICNEDKPFWYTSGTIGPYYINTHFLYGSEEKANNLLKAIDKEKGNIFTCPLIIRKITEDNYKNNIIYKGLIDEMCNYIRKNIDLNEVDCISGGERRDWFFSLIIADILRKPHITIYKDLSTVISVNGKIEQLDDLEGKKVLHIADLITEASSYERAWIPAIKRKNGQINWSIVVVDRMQGGAEYLESEGIKAFSMINIDKDLFDKVLNMNLINNEQYKMLINYKENPKKSMREFLINNPEFLENSLNADERTVSRAKLCLEKNIYELDIK